MSDKETLDLDAIEARHAHDADGIDEVDALADIPALIAAVRERDAEIARLKAELEELPSPLAGRYCAACGVFMDDEPSACVDEVVCDECAEDLPDEDDEDDEDDEAEP